MIQRGGHSERQFAASRRTPRPLSHHSWFMLWRFRLPFRGDEAKVMNPPPYMLTRPVKEPMKAAELVVIQHGPVRSWKRTAELLISPTCDPSRRGENTPRSAFGCERHGSLSFKKPRGHRVRGSASTSAKESKRQAKNCVIHQNFALPTLNLQTLWHI